MKIIRLIASLLAIAFVAAAAQAAAPTSEEIAAAMDKFQAAGIISAEDADYFKENTKPNARFDSAKFVTLIKGISKHLGTPTDNYTEALDTLKKRAFISPRSTAWDNIDKPDAKNINGDVIGFLATRLATLLKL